MSVDILIVGVPAPAVSHRVEHVVRRAFREASADGEWDVTLLPSDREGRWDLGLKGPVRRHIRSFSAPMEELPARVAEQIRRCLEQ